MIHRLKEIFVNKEQEEVAYEGLPQFSLKRSKRKSIAIQVFTDSSVVVRAPMRCSLKTIHNFVYKKIGWIEKQQQKFKSFPQPINHKYENGESFQFLGQKYSLRVELSIVNQIALSDNEIVVQTTSLKKDKVRASIEVWYKEQARVIFDSRLPHCLKAVEQLGITFSYVVQIRKMKSRWGSCSSDGKITLNTRLIEHPFECIDYVLVHELCHLLEMNHSKAFHDLMTKAMPDWRQRKKRLK